MIRLWLDLRLLWFSYDSVVVRFKVVVVDESSFGGMVILYLGGFV